MQIIYNNNRIELARGVGPRIGLKVSTLGRQSGHTREMRQHRGVTVYPLDRESQFSQITRMPALAASQIKHGSRRLDTGREARHPCGNRGYNSVRGQCRVRVKGHSAHSTNREAVILTTTRPASTQGKPEKVC